MFRLRSIRPAALGLAALLAAGPAGCGSPPAVRGTVTLDGKPVSIGTISFEAADGGSASAGAGIEDGKFELPPDTQLTPGKKVVVVRASMKTGRKVPAGPPAPPGTMVDELVLHPPPGGKPEPLDADIKPGTNELKFELTSKPTRK